jgi:hypothetical protein
MSKRKHKIRRPQLVFDGKCSKCGLQVEWQKNGHGKWQLYNQDGSTHWDLCKEVNVKSGEYKGELTKNYGKTGAPVPSFEGLPW